MRIKFGFLLLMLSFNVFAQSTKMVFAIDLIRHGDRTPISSIPTAPHVWLEGKGQLTAVGMQQEFQLGVSLRQRYIQSNHLLPLHYQNETLVVQATEYDRTIMSAECVLQGLYPLGTGPVMGNGKAAVPGRYQPVPIYTLSKDQEALFVADKKSEQMHKLLEKYVFSRADWKKKTTELQPQFARFSQLTGVKVTNLYQIKSIADTIYIYQLHHIALPEGMTKKEANTIINAGQFAFATAFKPEQIGQLTGHNLLVYLANYLRDAQQQKSNLKYLLLSAHDSTLLSAMSALHAPLNQVPHYASDLSIALYKKADNYTVKVIYNGQPVKLPGCKGTVCTFAEFIQICSK